jgi:fructokinase
MTNRPLLAPPTIACFGEVLWDLLPQGIFLGGAPLNVAYHASRQGVTALMVSAVGRDFLGDEARRRIAAWGLNDRWIGRCKGQPTGTVRVALDAAGIARFRIEKNVAWDWIAPPATRLQFAPAAIVYGSLALRSASNRRALARLFATLPDAWRVLDLNLRAPFDRGAAVAFALRHATVVKLNDDELARMTGRKARTPAGLAAAAQRFARAHGVHRVCVTAGARGAGLWWDGAWHWAPARRVQVCDTVGAGDAFLAALLAALLLRRAAPRRALADACRLGEFVAASDGATPPYRCDARGRPLR